MKEVAGGSRKTAGRRFAADRAGAAEMIGDILLVVMSVFMVSLLALQLSTVQSPTESLRADLEASYDGQNVTIMHMGGEPLDNISTTFYLFINDTLVRRANMTDGLAGTRWNMGESWVLAFPAGLEDRLRLQVIDTRNSAIILDQVLLRGPDLSSVPDLGVSASELLVLYRGAAFNDTDNPMAGDNVTFNVTVHNFGNAGAYGFIVRLTDYSELDRKSYSVLETTMDLDGLSSALLSVNYTIPGGSWGIHTAGVRLVPLPNETRFANNYASRDYRVGYLVLASHPNNPVLRIRSMESFPRYPVHGGYVNLTAHISNQGGVPANATVRYYLGSVSPANLIGTDSELGVPVGGESLSTIKWRTTLGGLHTVIINVTDPAGLGDEQNMTIAVIPNVLLVDDDRASDGAPRDVGASMKEALAGAGASYTVHTVPGVADGPFYDTGEHPMRDYDLVIWLTGYEPGTTITANDQSALTRYLYENHGRLWLIGQDIVSGLGPSNIFLMTAMHVESSTPGSYMDAGATALINGTGILPGSSLQMNDPFPTGLADRTDALEVSDRTVSAFNENGGANRSLGILFNATTNNTPTTDTYKAALFSFEPSQLAEPNDRPMLVYEMLLWFELQATWGRDLAVANQRFSKTTPNFMEDVNITIWLRNNGLEDEPVDRGRLELQLGFYVDGNPFAPKEVAIESSGGLTVFYPATSEFWIPQDTTNISLEVPGRGGYIKVSMVWTADKIGQHTVTGHADPHDHIQEVNELNNEIASEVGKTIYVRYGTLLVDDDGSANNGGASYNATGDIAAALDRLGYQYHTCATSGGGDGPSTARLELYNAIIWCTGEVAAPLTAADRANLTAFLDRGDGRYLWMIGSRAVDDGSYGPAGDAFIRDYLRVQRTLDPQLLYPASPRTPASIEGAYLDPLAHGARYAAAPAFADQGRLLVPSLDGRGVTYQNPAPDAASANEVAYCDAQDGTADGWYRRIVQPGTVSTMSNVYDAQVYSRVMLLERTGASANPNTFLAGDYSLTSDVNPYAVPWKDGQRFTAQLSFNSAIDFTFMWHLTDTAGNKHTLTYSNSDTDNLGAEPVHHGLGAAAADGQWHTATRDLLADLREGAGAAGLNIREVDGFEVAIGTGSIRVDNVTLSRPFNSVRHENRLMNYRTVTTAWDPSFLTAGGGTDSITEMTYLVMNWFNLFDTRTELRVTHLDLYFGNLTPLRTMDPMLGESYLLKAMVWNPGGARGDAVVRFCDGATVIDSVSVTIERDSFVLAEIIWTPLYAGTRTISVLVDPDSILTEVFKFNNAASVTLEVYFFYDDMEEGTKNWVHEATIARINGEAPLEYLDKGSVATSVISRWSSMDGWYNNTDNMGLANITSTYHSHNASYYMHEPFLQKSRYEFWMPDDGDPGFYAIGIGGTVTFEVSKADNGGVWRPIYVDQTLRKGEMRRFTAGSGYALMTSYSLYRVESEGPLLIVKTSQEGSNVNIANFEDGSEIGRDFGTLGLKLCLFALEPSTTAVVKSYASIANYNSAVTGGADTPVTTTTVSFASTAVEGNYKVVLPAGATATTPIWIHVVEASRQIMTFRCSGDNDELDTAISTKGSSTGSTLYYPYVGDGHEPRLIVYNTGPSPATVRLTEITASHHVAATGNAAIIKDNWVIPGYGMDTFGWRANLRGVAVPADNSRIRTYRLEIRSGDQTGIKAVYGGVSGTAVVASDFDVTFAGSADDTYEFFGMWRGNASEGPWLITAPIVTGEGSGGDVRKRTQHFMVPSETTVTVEGARINPYLANESQTSDPIAFADSGAGRSVNTIRYFATMGTYLTYETLGNVTGVAVSGVTGATVNTAAMQIYLPRGRYDNLGGVAGLTVTVTGNGTWYFGLRKFHFMEGGSFVWLLDHVRTWNAFNYSTAKFCGPGDLTLNAPVGPKVFWNFTSDNRIIEIIDGSGNCWIHTILPFEGAVVVVEQQGRGGGRAAAVPRPWDNGDRTPRDRNLTTETFSLEGVSSATLSFWQKYDMKIGSNGGVLLVGTAPAAAGPWSYKYIMPRQAYPGNLKISEWGSAHLKDGWSPATDMMWCWNGISGSGRFSWEQVDADLTPFVGNRYVRARFAYLYCGGGTGYGWAIDDVEVKVRRSDSVAVTTNTSDQWELVREGSTYGDDFADGRFAWSGAHSWWCHNPQSGMDTLKGGIDNSLTTIPIDLSRAKDARLSAKLRFNIYYPEGRPPDGFRVEVSGDNGVTWRQINMGVRSAWNVSGEEAAGPDGTCYTGVDIGDNWVMSGTVTRLNCDLSGWAGSVIQIRFRVVTRNDTAQHYDDLTHGFGGLFVDDVTVVGNTTTGGGRWAPACPAPGPVTDGGSIGAHDVDGGTGDGGGAGPDGGACAGAHPAAPCGPFAPQAAGPAARCVPDRRARVEDSRFPTE